MLSNSNILIRENYGLGITNTISSFKQGLQIFNKLRYIIHDKKLKYENCRYLQSKNQKDCKISLLTSQINSLKKDSKFFQKIADYIRFLQQKISEGGEQNKLLREKIQKLRAEINNIKYKVIQIEHKLKESIEQRNFLICVREKISTSSLPEEFLRKEKELLISSGRTKAFEKMFFLSEEERRKKNLRKRLSVLENKALKLQLSDQKERKKDYRKGERMGTRRGKKVGTVRSVNSTQIKRTKSQESIEGTMKESSIL